MGKVDRRWRWPTAAVADERRGLSWRRCEVKLGAKRGESGGARLEKEIGEEAELRTRWRAPLWASSGGGVLAERVGNHARRER